MKLLSVALACVGMFVVTNCWAADAPTGFEKSLFDGQSLAGWTVENGCKATIKDGLLLLEEGNGWLRSDHTYSDFVMHVEWKALQEVKYDAGIYIRTANGGAPFPKSSYQVNLLQGKEGNIGSLPGAASTGLIKSGDWNAFDITVVEDKVSLVINGKPAYEAAGLKNRSGYVGFQIEVPLGGQFLVRNVSIKELGYTSLFNGKDLAGWEGAEQPKETCWAVEDGLLVCDGKKGPWLRSDKEYGDFNLRFDYLVSPGGNSGIYVRVPKDGNHHRADDQAKPAGFEVQVLDDTAPQHAKLKDYQYGGSVYDICGASQKVGRPIGDWNTMEINCRGQNVTTTHNGVVIVEVTPETHELIKLRQESGYLGLQNHSTVVKFRNLRIGPLLPVVPKP